MLNPLFQCRYCLNKVCDVHVRKEMVLIYYEYLATAKALGADISLFSYNCGCQDDSEI